MTTDPTKQEGALNKQPFSLLSIKLNREDGYLWFLFCPPQWMLILAVFGSVWQLRM